MDLSNPFRCIMQRLFPNASIIADRFHYVKLFGECLKRSRLDTCSSLKDEKMAKSIKKNLHLFDKYRKDLDDQTEWYDRHLKKYFTCRTYVEYIFEQDGTDGFYQSCYEMTIVKWKYHIPLIFVFFQSRTQDKKLLYRFIGGWPLCYSWIGYLRSMVSPQVSLSIVVNQIFGIRSVYIALS